MNYITANINFIFVTLIVFLFIYALWRKLYQKLNSKLIESIPAVLVSLGILGTFVGIFLGLKEFNVHEINESIPTLLEGLKTAFLTSICGLFFSILLKVIFDIHTSIKLQRDASSSDDPIDLINKMVLGIEGIESNSKNLEETLLKCFRSDEEFSLLSQLKLIRQEISDTRKETTQSFREFAEKIAKTNTDALVEALKKVIDDFNVLLSELVGESFKELSTAMIKLTEWQSNYKDQMDKMEVKVETLIDGMESSVNNLRLSADEVIKIREAINNISYKLSEIFMTTEMIEVIMSNLKLTNQSIKEGIESINDMGEKAKHVVPEINEKMDSLMNIITNSVTKNVEKMNESTNIVTSFVETSTKNIEELSDKQMKLLRDSVNVLDKTLEEELQKALSSLGGSLAALSGKFVEDYQPLTDKLREIVRISEAVNA